MQLALAGIVMFFMALTSSFLVRKGLGDDWVAFALPRVLWFNTLVLLASSVTIEIARRQLRRASTDVVSAAGGALRRRWALLFLAGQIHRLARTRGAGRLPATNPSSSFFYLLTALHGAAPGRRNRGAVLRGVPAVAAFAHHASRRRPSLASIYWHFMDGLWVFLFALLYSGTVNCARDENRSGVELAVVRRRVAVCDQFEEAGDVAVHRLRYADVFGLAADLQLFAARQSRLAAAV